MTRFTPGPDTARDFREALGRFATGVTVVTTRDGDVPLGITANSFASVSLDPPLVLWSPARSSSRFAPFARAERFAIHVMGQHQYDITMGFVRGGAAFGSIAWHEAECGTPMIEGCLARFECTRWAVYDGGDHAIIVGRVTSATLGPGEPLLFTGGAWGRFTAAG